MKITYERTKRALDLAIAIPALIISMPLQATIAVAVAVKLGRPVLFRQVRPGLHGRPFELVKFRTMLSIDPARGRMDDSTRLTSFGRALRSTSLDELPTLWNIVRGDLSLVGPRPLLVQYLALYDERQARRHEVMPGLTGLAQVAGRNSLSWERKLELDVEYVARRSLRLDLAILLATVEAVLHRRGISAPGSATMPEFSGNQQEGQP